MILNETTFHSSNVGLPYAAFGQEEFHTGPHGFRISNMNRMVPELLIWADRHYDNRLEFRGVSLALYGFEGNTLMRVGVETVPVCRFALAKAAILIEKHL